MKYDKKIYKIEYTKGSGPGGQHKNKVESCVVITHIPSGLQEKCEDSRSKIQNEKLAFERLNKRLDEIKFSLKKEQLNKKRKEAIEKNGRIRTYNFIRGEVEDHRTKKKASIEDVLSGKIELLK
jgi:peptide chain release factor 1